MPKNTRCVATRVECMIGFMALPYTTTPKNYSELVDAVRGQLERSRELSMMGLPMKIEEKVIITPEAFMDVLDTLEEVREILTAHAQLFQSIQQVFMALFEVSGISLEELFEMAEDDGDDEED